MPAAPPQIAPPATARARPALRLVNALLYGGFAALGFGLCARPALLELRGLGLLAPALPWDVPLGRAFLLLALLLACWTVRLMLAAALGARVRLPERAGFLLCVAAALAARAAAGDPAPPRDPAPALLDGLRAAAALLDQGYAERGRYAPDAAVLDARLAQLPAPGFCSRGRPLPLRVRLLDGAAGAQREPLPGDPPGTLYLALSADGSRAWLTALTLEGGEPAPLRASGRPLVLQARAGTHSAPGRDPLVPEYPTMQLLHDRVK